MFFVNVFLTVLVLGFCNGIPFKLNVDNDAPSLTDDGGSSGYSFAIDIADSASVSTLQCVYQQGYSAVFIQVYSPSNGGSINQYGIQSINAAYSAQLGTEIYVTPSTTGKSGSQQFSETYNSLKNQGINIRSIWLQVSSSINWPNNIQSNIDFIQSFVNQADANGITAGIYTNFMDWQQITGNYAYSSSSLKLWYYNVLGQGTSGETPANFDDFRPFGQWSQASIKQFAQSENMCGLNCNRNVYPCNQKKSNNKIPFKKSKISVGGFV